MRAEQTEAVSKLPPGFSEAASLEGHLQHWADLRPEAPALKDPSNRKAAGLGTLRRLDYWSLNKIVSRVAMLFADQGLGRGDIIAIQLANTVEFPITILAAMRAGLVPCLLPMLWRRHELEAVFQKLPIKAVVCQGDHSEHAYDEMMCELAAKNLSVRFLYGAGSGLADGIMPLNEVFERPAGRDLGRSFKRSHDPSPNDPAVVLWGSGPDGKLSPLWRTNAELITAGMMHALETGITSHDCLLNPFPLSSLTGFAAMFVPWLISGASMVLHEPFEEAGFLKDLADNDVTYAVLPAPVFNKHYEAGTLQSAAPFLSRAGCVWAPRKEAGVQGSPGMETTPPLRVFDIHSLGEFASIILPRKNGREVDSLPLGPIKTPFGDSEGMVMLETRLKGSVQKAGADHPTMTGRLLIRGALVPTAAYALWNKVSGPGGRDGHDGWLNTGLLASITERSLDAVRCLPDPRFFYHGGITLTADDLDAVYGEFADFADVAAIAIPDPLVGDRIFASVVPAPGHSASMSAFREYLSERAVAPYKMPEKLVVVSAIPRDDQGRVLRNDILNKI